MVQTAPLLALPIDWDKAIEQAVHFLNQAGLQVLRSFDLRVARSVHTDCTCPHHGTEQCDCQMVVLLVYDHEHPPATLVAHGHDGQTHFAIVETPGQYPDSELQVAVRRILREDHFILPNREIWANVT